MLTVKLLTPSISGLSKALIYEAETIEITLNDDNSYFADIFKGSSIYTRLTLYPNTADTLYVENSSGKTIQRLEALCPPEGSK